METNFIKVTLYNGLIGYININAITGFCEMKNEDINIQTKIVTSTIDEWFVRETIEEIKKLILNLKKEKL
jgi:hypothetical protein